MAGIRTVIVLAITATWITAGWPTPAPLPALSPRPLDDQLVDLPDTDPLDEFDRELFRPADKQGRAGDLPDEVGDDLQERLRRETGAAADTPDNNPLLKVIRGMQEVRGMLGQEELGPDTQDLQEQIISDLDELIKQARKQCGQCPQCGGRCQPNGQCPACGKQAGKKKGEKGRAAPSDSPPGPPRPKAGSGGSKQPGPTRANKDDTPNPGRAPTKRVDMQQMQKLIQQLWGELPPRERARVTQPTPEEFLPKYELLIEEYFRRLSEEKTNDTTRPE